jgi:hypothetical protein
MYRMWLEVLSLCQGGPKHSRSRSGRGVASALGIVLVVVLVLVLALTGRVRSALAHVPLGWNP